jgi:hypothetical protein
MGTRRTTFRLIIVSTLAMAFAALSPVAQASPSGHGKPSPTPTITPVPTPTPSATAAPSPSATPNGKGHNKPSPTPAPTATPPPPSPTPPPATPDPGTKLDVRQPGSSGTINGALFYQTDQQAGGTGYIDPFLRVQHTPTEQGYNTDGTPVPFNDKPPSLYQHSLLQSSLATFTINGVQYYKFILDSNQSGISTSDHTLSLDQLQIYTSNNPSPTTTTFITGTGTNLDGTLAFDSSTHLAYNLNIGGLTTNSVYTDATGSGIADVYAYIPVSDFVTTDKYVILYFFAGSDFTADGGFEEWLAATTSAPPVPDQLGFLPVAALIAAMLSTHALLRRRRRSAHDPP